MNDFYKWFENRDHNKDEEKLLVGGMIEYCITKKMFFVLKYVGNFVNIDDVFKLFEDFIDGK